MTDGQSPNGTAVRFTPQELRILRVLSDGDVHRKAELMACLDDELSSEGALRKCLSVIRGKLARRSETVICQYRDRQLFYRHVRLIRYDE